MGDEPLMTKYISLYSIAGQKNVMVAHILRIEPHNIFLASGGRGETG
jgi:hypothetical protein